MMKHPANYFLFFLILFSFIISFSVFRSFKFQRIIQTDTFNKVVSFSSDDIDYIPSIPNIGVTTIPIDAYKANYHFIEGNVVEANRLLDQATKANPYLHYSDFTKARYFRYVKNFDSAYVYAKKAFYGWPKYIEHYKLFNDILIERKDTLQILQAFDSINNIFLDRSNYFKNFLESLSKAKMRYLITSYDSLSLVNTSMLQGSWQQIFEYESGELIRLKNKFNISDDFFSNADSKYHFKIISDSISLFYLSNNKKIATYGIRFSISKDILVLENVPIPIGMDTISYQNQFFKKIQ